MCFKYLISTIKNSLEIGHINLRKWGQQREKKIFPSKNFAWVTARTQVPEMAQTSPCLLMGEQHESVAPALLRQREGCWCCAGALRKIGLAFEVGRAWECCTTFILGAGTCWNSNYWETGLRQSEALPLPCKEVQFFYLKLVFLTSPNVKKQWSQATPASLPGKPGKVKWGLLLDSPTSAAVTEGFKKNPNKQTWAQERHALMSVLKKKKSMKKRGLGLFIPYSSSPFHTPNICLPHQIATSVRLSPRNPQAFVPWLAAWLEAAGKWGETRRAISIAAWLLLLRAVLRILHTPLVTAGPLCTSPFLMVCLEARLADWERLSQDVPSHTYFYGCSRCLNKSHLK